MSECIQFSIEPNVTSFISKFLQAGAETKTVDTFTRGCCYWFAVILQVRFNAEDATLMYDEITNHFGTRINERVYDISGYVTEKYDWQTWDEFAVKDEALVRRIIRDCMIMED